MLRSLRPLTITLSLSLLIALNSGSILARQIVPQQSQPAQKSQDDPEAKVSRRHARIQILNNQFLIEDLGSTNGTFVNRGPRLLPGNKQPLKNGDEIIVGKTFLKFVVN